MPGHIYLTHLIWLFVGMQNRFNILTTEEQSTLTAGRHYHRQ